MDQTPLRPAEDSHGQDMTTCMRSMRVFTKPVFSFSQENKNQHSNGLPAGYAPLRTEGTILIKVLDRPASAQGIEVENEIRYHKPISPVEIASDEYGITITSPPSVLINQEDNDNDPCVFIKSTLYIPHNYPLSSFYLEATSLPIFAPSGIPVRSENPIHISAPSSLLDISSLKSPSPLRIDASSLYLSTTSGPITGDFTLRDSLTIHTTSSSININLALLPSKSSSSNTTAISTPATLDLKSASGSITVRTTTISQPAKIPNREYRSTIRTNSGSISASLVHGSLTDLKTDSGSIIADLYPHGNASIRSDISTSTLSGRTEIKVHPSLANPSTPLRNFHAMYNGVSGSMQISYPAQWEGKVEGSTVSGGIGVVWPGLKVEENRGGWGRHVFQGAKGTGGKGVLGFRDVSGRVDLRGEEGVGFVCEEEEEEEEEVEGRGRGVGSETGDREGDGNGGRVRREEDTETEVGEEVLLTPTSEAGDEWLLVQ